MVTPPCPSGCRDRSPSLREHIVFALAPLPVPPRPPPLEIACGEQMARAEKSLDSRAGGWHAFGAALLSRNLAFASFVTGVII